MTYVEKNVAPNGAAQFHRRTQRGTSHRPSIHLIQDGACNWSAWIPSTDHTIVHKSRSKALAAAKLLDSQWQGQRS